MAATSASIRRYPRLLRSAARSVNWPLLELTFEQLEFLLPSLREPVSPLVALDPVHSASASKTLDSRPTCPRRASYQRVNVRP